VGQAFGGTTLAVENSVEKCVSLFSGRHTGRHDPRKKVFSKTSFLLVENAVSHLLTVGCVSHARRGTLRDSGGRNQELGEVALTQKPPGSSPDGFLFSSLFRSVLLALWFFIFSHHRAR